MGGEMGQEIDTVNPEEKPIETPDGGTSTEANL